MTTTVTSPSPSLTPARRRMLTTLQPAAARTGVFDALLGGATHSPADAAVAADPADDLRAY